MTFLMTWLTVGLSLLVMFGLDDILAYLVIDGSDRADAPEERVHTPVIQALCLTFVVVAWPLLLLEYMKKHS